jgi:hypothetical protein
MNEQFKLTFNMWYFDSKNYIPRIEVPQYNQLSNPFPLTHILSLFGSNHPRQLNQTRIVLHQKILQRSCGFPLKNLVPDLLSR